MCIRDSHDSELFNQPNEVLVDILKMARTQSNWFVWLDTADSTGTCHFEVLPYVDRYLKKQLLVDMEMYKKPIWGGRIHCQYYHEKYNLDDKNVSGTIDVYKRQVLNEETRFQMILY